ncbi:MAG TPA: SurA N-terminal domain-containing protein [Marinagarivorans sp.]
MLQSLRENMKGPTAKIVVGLAVAAMVLFGVESLFVNSVGGSDVATVNGEDVGQVELQRAIEQQKSRLRQQRQLEENSDLLDDDRLRGPALMNLVRQKALHQAAADAGMNVSPAIVKRQLAEAFTRDGEFNSALLNNYIASYGYTPATLAKSEANAYILRQLFNGINNSEFVTQVEMDVMAAVAGQKRSFSTISIPRSAVESSVSVSDSEIEAYYNDNPAQFTDPEKIALSYVELSVDALAAAQSVTDEEVRQEYERELSEFNANTEYRISHILIEDGDDAAKKIAEVADKLAAGDEFAEIAKEYSDDLGSKALGGELGALVEGAFPAEFEEAAKALAEGQVSELVETDAGAHFIRLDRKRVTAAPEFEARREALTQMLKEQKASVEYLDKIQVLEEVSFGAPNLSSTAEALGVEVQSTPLFSKGRGIGIAAIQSVASAAFGDDVYLHGQNSRVLEVAGDRALVVRLEQKVPAALRPLETVRATIRKQLKDQKVASELESLSAEVLAGLQSGKAPQAVAESVGYDFEAFEAVERSSADVDFMISREVFTMPRPVEGAPVTATVSGPEALTVILLESVQEGEVDSLPKEQRESMQQQLKNQLAMSAVEAFEERVFEDATYKIK